MKNEEEKKELHTVGTPLDEEKLENVAGGETDAPKIVHGVVVLGGLGEPVPGISVREHGSFGEP